MNLLDTDTISYFLRGEGKVVEQLGKSLNNNQKLFTTILNVYEIRSGLYHHDSKKQLRIFNEFIQEIEILVPDSDSIEISSLIYSQLRKSGKPIGDLDILIAGIAVSQNKKLITNNLMEFTRIKNLNCESWLR